MVTPEPQQDPARVDLEAKLTFLERTVEVMSKTMHEQSGQIEKLERRLTDLVARMEAASDDSMGPHNDPPPHY
jgi:uncharacterized coiled-coil protein SlyX